MSGGIAYEIDVGDLDAMLRSGAPLTLLDVREDWETDICLIKGSVKIPLGELPDRADMLPPDQTLVVICHHGVRSLHATVWLRNNGFPKTTSLRGGIDAWAQQVDRAMALY